MYLSKLLIKNFGKFNNKEITLTPGINVIKGRYSSGKTTVKEFIISMLYGFNICNIDKNDKFEKYKPNTGNSFSGKAYIKNEEKTFFVERSFARKNSRLNVLNIESGRELKVSGESLDGTVFNYDKSDFLNCLCIDDREEYAGYITRDFKNITATNTDFINKDKSISLLKKRKEKYDINSIEKNIAAIDKEIAVFDDVEGKLKETKKKIKDVTEELAIETARRKREARRLIQTKNENADENVDENVDDTSDKTDEKVVKEDSSKAKGEAAEKKNESNVKNVFLDADLIKDYKPEKKLTERLWFIILTGLFVIGVITAIVYILPFESAVRQIFVICTILFVIVTIVEDLFAKGIFDEEIRTPSEEEFKRIIYELERKTETYEEVEIDMSFAKEYKDRREKLANEERNIINQMARRDELREERKAQEKKIESANKEIHAINMAINTINDISKQINTSYNELINENVSDIISKISENRFRDLYINEKNHIMVKNSNGYIEFDNIDEEGKKQIYISLRLAMARSLCKNNMPIIIDELLDNLEDDLFARTVDIIGRIKTDQLIILSADNKIEKKLENLNKNYNTVSL